MKSIIGLPQEVSESIRSAWQWIDDQTNVSGLNDDLRIPFRLSFQITVCELISRHYVDGLNQDEYLEHFTQCQVEDMVNAIFEYDTDNKILNYMLLLINSNMYEQNTFWSLVISEYVQSYEHMGKKPLIGGTMDDLQRSFITTALTFGVSKMIEMAIEEYEIIEHLEPLPDKTEVDNVEVVLSSGCIYIWS